MSTRLQLSFQFKTILRLSEYFQKPLSVNTIRRAICRCQLKLYHAKCMIELSTAFLEQYCLMLWILLRWGKSVLLWFLLSVVVLCSVKAGLIFPCPPLEQWAEPSPSSFHHPDSNKCANQSVCEPRSLCSSRSLHGFVDGSLGTENRKFSETKVVWWLFPAVGKWIQMHLMKGFKYRFSMWK